MGFESLWLVDRAETGSIPKTSLNSDQACTEVVRAKALSRILETINGNWNSEVVQRDEGLRLHSA